MTTPRRRERIIDGTIVGGSAAVVLVLSIMLLSLLFGGQQQQTLKDIRAATRAQVCVLLLPVNDQGRDEGMTNSLCLIPNGIEPVDANGDGRIELDH